MRFSIEQIDPAKAKAFLAKNVKNRPLNMRTIENYAADMARGAWADTGDTVKIGRSGLLIDGQHRLEAIVKADVTITMAIAYDVPDSSFDSIDIGRVRKASDIVALRGQKHYTIVASACRLIYLDEHGLLDQTHPSMSSSRAQVRTVTNRDVIETMDACPDVIECAALVSTTYKFAGQLLAYGLAAYILWKLRRIEQVAADRFFSGLTDGLNLTAQDPLFMLRERLIRNQADKRKLERRELYAMTVKAWNATRLNKSFTPHALRLRTGGPGRETQLVEPI